MNGLTKVLTDIFQKPSKVKALAAIVKEQVPEEQLNHVVYTMYGQHLAGVPAATVEADILGGRWTWSSAAWETQRNNQKDFDDFISNPIEIVSGVMKCTKCGSDRVYTVQKQLRSSDEGFSSLSQCLSCRARWRIN